jgi:hypothetical protein
MKQSYRKGDKKMIKTLCKALRDKARTNNMRVALVTLAVLIAMLMTMFPLHIQNGNLSPGLFQIGEGIWRITIGNLVGASDADYTCDGVNDHEQFQAALDAMPAQGGQIFVIDVGNYTWGDGETVTRAIDNVSIIGVCVGVNITGDGVTPLFTAGGNNWFLSNLEVDAGGLDMGATTDWMKLHVVEDSTYYPLQTDDINIADLSSRLGVGGADTIFPADPGTDKYLMWDDDPGQLSWQDGGGVGDMDKATYDADDDGDIDTAAGGTEWDSSAATGVAYITAGAWGTKNTGITNTYIVVVDGNPSDDEFARWTPSGIEGRDKDEVQADLDLETGIDVQAYDAELAAIAGLTSAANKLIYFTGSGTADTSDLTAFARSILDDTNEATFKATVNLEIGTDVQAWDTDLNDIAALSDADSNFIVGNGANWVVESGATVRESLGLVIGTNVQAHDAELDALAGLTSAANKVPYFTGSGTADVTDFSAYGRSLVAVADEAAFKLLVNLEIGVDIISKSTFDTHEGATTGVHGVTGTILGTEDVDDTPANGATTDPISSNWAYDHETDTSTHGVTGDIVGTTDSQTLSNKDLGSDLDFAGYMAVAMTCDRGATLPTSPTAGQWFLHNPTGRSLLYQYTTSWSPLISFGSMTVYVDNTDGTDDLNHGTAVDSDAFKTVQYAVDVIPGLVGGSVYIYVNAETYAETVTIRGKSVTGNYGINIYGTLTESASATADSKTTGTGATQGTLTDTGAFGAYDNKLIYITATGEYRVIDSDTADIITIAGTFADSTNLGYKVYDWGTVINRVDVADNKAGVAVSNVKLAGATYSCVVSTSGSLSLYQCWLAATALAQTNAALQMYYSYAISSGSLGTLFGQTGASIGYINRCKICQTNGSYYCMYLINATGLVQYGTIFEGESGGADDANGLQTINNSSVIIADTAGGGYSRIRNCDNGIYAASGGVVTGTSTIQYSGNDNDEYDTVDGAPGYSYID